MNLPDRYVNHEKARVEPRTTRYFLTDADHRLFVVRLSRTNGSSFRYIGKSTRLPVNALWMSSGELHNTMTAVQAIRALNSWFLGTRTPVRVGQGQWAIILNQANGYWCNSTCYFYVDAPEEQGSFESSVRSYRQEPAREEVPVTQVTSDTLVPTSPMPFARGKTVEEYLNDVRISSHSVANYAILRSTGVEEKKNFVCYGGFTGNLGENENAIIVDKHVVTSIDQKYHDSYNEIEQWVRTEGPFNKAFMYSGVHAGSVHTIQNCAKLGPGPVMFNLILVKYFRRGYVVPYHLLRKEGFSVREAILTCLSVRGDNILQNRANESIYYPSGYWADWQPYSTDDPVQGLLKLFTEEFSEFRWNFGRSMFENLSAGFEGSSVRSVASRILNHRRETGFGAQSTTYKVDELVPLALYFRGALNEIES